MLLKRSDELRYSDVTPREVYLNRRKFLYGLGVAAGAVAAGGGIAELVSPSLRALAASQLARVVKGPFNTDEKITPFKDVTHYNNYYEFGTDKDQPAKYAQNFRTSPWSVSVEGEVARPRTFTMDEILKLAPLEERIYRHRCVEAWSIVVPWIGYSFSVLANLAEPTSKARFVAFQSAYDPKQMPLARNAGIRFPYVDGLRLDEAMNPLTLLCVGMFGQTLPNQDGAPVRMVIPWKYGIKSIKALVKIRFVRKQPPTTWNSFNPHEYGFYSNVNPEVDHPRWSQAKERRLGEFFRRKTLMFNGYAEQVASLYTGMDLVKYF